jgi:hypothetical protein
VRNRMDRKLEDINRKKEEIYKHLQKEHPEIHSRFESKVRMSFRWVIFTEGLN